MLQPKQHCHTHVYTVTARVCVTVSNEVRSAVVNKPLGVEFNVIKVECILMFSYD